MKNKLRIRANSLNLDLVGEAEYVLRAYDAIQPVLLERFEESVEGVLESQEGRPDVASKTMKLHATGTHEEASDEQSEHLNLVICNDVYHKIHLVERQRVQQGVFGRAFDLAAVRRIYVNRAQREQFKRVLPTGKVLWRELTAAGKAVVQQS